MSPPAFALGLFIWIPALVGLCVWLLVAQPSKLVAFLVSNAVGIPGVVLICLWNGASLPTACLTAVLAVPTVVIVGWLRNRLNDIILSERPKKPRPSRG